MRPALSPSRLMAHASDYYHVTGVLSCVMRPVMRHASCVLSCVMRHASCHASRIESVQTHGSCVRLLSRDRRPVMAHGSCVMRPASGSCVRRPASGVRLMRPAHASIQSLSFSHRRPLSVMTTTRRRQFIHALMPLDLRLLGYMA